MATLPTSDKERSIHNPEQFSPVILKKLSKGLLPLLLVLLAFGNCTKVKSTDIGTELLPSVDNVFTFDTSLTVVTDNFLFGDSAVPLVNKDYQGKAMEHVLGSITNDPMFGKTSGTIFMELKPPFYKYYFENVKDSLYLDSVILCLKWNRTWGDTNALQTINVYEAANYIRFDTSYNTNVNFRYFNLLGSRTFPPSILDDSIYLRKQTLAKQLRIRLSEQFGRKLLSQDSTTGMPYSSDSAFREFFKGFAIAPESTGPGAAANALMGFALSDTNTHLVLHYRYVKDGKTDTTSRKFSFDNSNIGGNANRVIRDHRGSELEKFLPVSAKGDSLVYLQTSPGSYCRIRMPSLDGFKAAKGNVMINLAELIVEQVPETSNALDNILTGPDRLYADFQDTINGKQSPFLTDALTGGVYDPVVFGGFPRKVSVPGGTDFNRYNIYLTRYIQNYITRNSPNFPLFLYAPYNVSYSNLLLGFNVNQLAKGRVRLGGGSHSTKRMRLRIVYTKI